ncbi:DNA-3-methyladenine glycosylase family protein [Haloplanus sp. GCM10025708]|uniref:DNA-3-methyladenine glycosylase family protein n=1 Tax=Haloferacaceae TaxID=1644056 RepID=UPI00361FEB57
MSSRTVDERTDAVAHLVTDPVMAELVDRHGVLTVDPATDTFERLVVAILRQQVSMAAAESMRESLYEAFDITPERIADADEEALRSVGLSRQKAGYIRNVAAAYVENDYDAAYFRDLSDDEVTDELTAISGVGPWTAKIFLQFCLGRPDVFPVEDLGIRRSMQDLFDPDMTRGEMRDRAEAWRPYRSVASLYLWRHTE